MGRYDSTTWKTGSEKSKTSNLERCRLVREEYNKDPVRCALCETPLEFEKKKGKFCSHSCAATFNNKGVRRHGVNCRVCPDCGGYKSLGSVRCQRCKVLKSLKECQVKPMSEFFSLTASRAKHNRIRWWARKSMKIWGVEQKCVGCGYDIIEVLEVDHIISITEFPPETLMGVVNSKENLRYVCPTCHKEYELGIK